MIHLVIEHFSNHEVTIYHTWHTCFRFSKIDVSTLDNVEQLWCPTYVSRWRSKLWGLHVCQCLLCFTRSPHQHLSFKSIGKWKWLFQEAHADFYSQKKTARPDYLPETWINFLKIKKMIPDVSIEFEICKLIKSGHSSITVITCTSARGWLWKWMNNCNYCTSCSIIFIIFDCNYYHYYIIMNQCYIKMKPHIVNFLRTHIVNLMT